MATYYSSSEIADLAKQTLPCKFTDLKNKADQYHQSVFRELVYGFYLANMNQLNEGLVPFNVSRVRKNLGRYGKPQRYWWDWLHKNFPLVEIVSKGNSIKGVSSMAKSVIPLDIILAGSNGRELVEAVYSQFSGDEEIHVAPINMYSLENFILSSTAENNLHPTYQRNLKDARIIFTIAKELDGKLPMVVSHSNFGRTYYKGINLQSVHKIVRHAALGACYSVDIDSSVFNWKYSIVPFREELTYTRELIRDKKRIRKLLATKLFGNSTEYSIKTIKQVLTAISFGARSETNSWFKNEMGQWTQGAVSEIIRSKELRTELFSDEWMHNFMAEQDRINRWIGDDLTQAVKQGLIPEKYTDDLKSERGRISRGKLISWAYQQSEQQLMREILKVARAEPILQIHDGIYFKTKPDMPSMNTVLQAAWPIATLSIEEITNYNYRNRDLDRAHLDHIAQEERAANNGVCPRRTGIHTEARSNKQYNTHNEPDWETEMMREYNNLIEYDYPIHIQRLLRG